MLDHSFFFAESVRMVIESKSRWSTEDFDDVLLKSQAVRDIVVTPGPSLDDTLAVIQLDIAALKESRAHSGILYAPFHIATGGVFLAGGFRAFDPPRETITDEVLQDADDRWPDVLLLLEPGKMILKDYPPDQDGRLLFFDYGEDALLAFTNALLQTVAGRSVLTESEFYLTRYAFRVLVETEPYEALPFPLTRFPPGRTPLWE